MEEVFIHPTAVVDEGAVIGPGSHIWHFSHIMPGAVLGESCNLGQNVMVASGVRLGNNVKIQNNVSVYSGVVCEDDVFLGPSCVFTNVKNPRSAVSRRGCYETTVVRRGQCHCGMRRGNRKICVCGCRCSGHKACGGLCCRYGGSGKADRMDVPLWRETVFRPGLHGGMRGLLAQIYEN